MIPAFRNALTSEQTRLSAIHAAHAIHQGRMGNFVEAGLDVALQHPLVIVGAVVVDLGDRVVRPPIGAEPIRARLEIRLENGSSTSFRLAWTTRSVMVGIPRRRSLPFALGIITCRTSTGRNSPDFNESRSWLRNASTPTPVSMLAAVAVDPRRPGAPVAGHPLPRGQQERRIIDEVEQVIEPATGIVARPSVQLGLHPPYPRSAGSAPASPGAGIHRRIPPGLPSTSAAGLLAPQGRPPARFPRVANPFPATPHRTSMRLSPHAALQCRIPQSLPRPEIPLWISSWQSRQTIRVLRRRDAISLTHSGCSARFSGGDLSDASCGAFRRPYCVWQSSHRPDMSRSMSSARSLPPNSGEFLFEDYPRGPAGQRNPTPPGNQWPLPRAALDRDLQASTRTCGCLPGGAVAVPDLVDADLVLMAQRLGHRPLHDPPQQAETVPVVGQLVVLRDAPELRLVTRHDPEIRVVSARSRMAAGLPRRM